jgi:predicted XRE-type DNA-binding protein
MAVFAALAAAQAQTFPNQPLRINVMGHPALRTQVVSYLISHWKISERRACRIVAQPRSTHRYMSTKDPRSEKRGDWYDSVWDALADTPEQAANLRARADLMRQIAEIIQASGWKQVEAAERCGVTQPRINDLVRGRVSRFSLDALVNIATALGRRVRVELEAA